MRADRLHGPDRSHLRSRFQPPVPPKIDGRVEAHLVAICCGPPPEGRARWTPTLLAGGLRRRGLVTSVGREAVRRALERFPG
jgi:hypothetical protein